MVDIFTGTVPNLTQSQPNFDTNTQAILDYIGNLAPQLNEWVGAYVQDTSSASSTSNSIGTGSKLFTVEAGKGYKVNMPVRASATTGNYMDGIVTAYSGTSLTVNFASSNGSGTFTSWQIFLTVPGSNVTLGSNTFTGDQIVPDEAYDATGWDGDLSVPTKNAVRGIIQNRTTGVAFLWPFPTAPSGSIAIPIIPTNLSRTIYPALHAIAYSQGYPWGSGDGSTTFGSPYLQSDGTWIQANGNVATISSGVVKDHLHYVARNGNGTSGVNGLGFAALNYDGNNNGPIATYGQTNSGPANLAAGSRGLWCIWL